MKIPDSYQWKFIVFLCVIIKILQILDQNMALHCFETATVIVDCQCIARLWERTDMHTSQLDCFCPLITTLCTRIAKLATIEMQLTHSQKLRKGNRFVGAQHCDTCWLQCIKVHCNLQPHDMKHWMNVQCAMQTISLTKIMCQTKKQLQKHTTMVKASNPMVTTGEKKANKLGKKDSGNNACVAMWKMQW